eukprot:8320587-Pyramimonas_sp.AAC.1
MMWCPSLAPLGSLGPLCSSCADMGKGGCYCSGEGVHPNLKSSTNDFLTNTEHLATGEAPVSTISKVSIRQMLGGSETV